MLVWSCSDIHFHVGFFLLGDVRWPLSIVRCRNVEWKCRMGMGNDLFRAETEALGGSCECDDRCRV